MASSKGDWKLKYVDCVTLSHHSHPHLLIHSLPPSSLFSFFPSLLYLLPLSFFFPSPFPLFNVKSSIPLLNFPESSLSHRSFSTFLIYHSPSSFSSSIQPTASCNFLFPFIHFMRFRIKWC